MAQRILIPLDGSKLGESALHYVEEQITNFSNVNNVEVHLINVIKSGLPYAPFSNEDIERSTKKGYAYLEIAGEELQKKGVKVTCKVIIGESGVSSAEAIIKEGDEIDADLVAMSTHGRRGLSRWAFGSVTEKVLRGGNIPTLVTRADKYGKGFK